MPRAYRLIDADCHVVEPLYPHPGCDWPYSRTVVGEMMDGVPQDERHRILAGNMVDPYRLPQSLEV